MIEEPEMKSSDLKEIIGLLESSSIDVWLDGGWGVDALLSEQTRAHRDVDIIVQVKDVPMVQEKLRGRGFSFKEGKPPHSFVLTNGHGLEVDIHAVVFDEEGNGIYRMQNGEDWIYPLEGFSGSGLVDGMQVKCLSPAVQVHCHAHGYTPVEKDFQDMEKLQAKFRVELPPQLIRG
jgi:lincosamide nucleotidyltransferase A/C/D/E